VLTGTATLEASDASPVALAAGDAFTMPAGRAHGLTAVSADLELLAVALPPQ
jgi:quercetin dioxygenase-like cupin family protein